MSNSDMIKKAYEFAEKTCKRGREMGIKVDAKTVERLARGWLRLNDNSDLESETKKLIEFLEAENRQRRERLYRAQGAGL